MDDPWGSPWAVTDSDKDPKLASPAKPDLAPPPRAFLSASSSPRIPAVPEPSPWGGDDAGFGEWATTSETPLAHSVWAGGWGGSSPNLLPTPRDDLLNTTSPITWPSNVATPKPANGSSAFRHPSPDPWATGFSSRRPSNDGVSTPRLVVEAASPVDSLAEPDTLGKKDALADHGPAWQTSAAGETTERPATKESGAAAVKSEDEDPVQEPTALAAIPSVDIRVSVESAPQAHEYQSSTPSNDNTDHEDERQDSPISSIDEEPQSLRPGLRKPPGKVQELVNRFDGIARAASEEPVVISRSRSKSPMSVGNRDGSDDTADFGDFEDAEEVEPPLAPQTTATESREPAAEYLGAADIPAALLPPAADHRSRSTSPIAMFGPLNFSVDLSPLAELFPTLPELSSDAAMDRDVPDHIIKDSFTQISERKTWYRVSRLGSSRRHNAGDDDSYRRVAWPSSRVHDETTKIVRRWMEEDSIAGRVALGGGISKTQKNMFGWDSSVEPVALDAVFGKKNPHSRASSLQPLQPPRLSLDAIDGPTKQPLPGLVLHRPSGSAGPAIASFGWSSTSVASTGQTRPTNSLRGPPDANAAPSNADISTPHVSSASGPPAFPTPAISTAGLVQGGNVPDEDDEWGELVSSPVASQFIETRSAVQQSLTAPISAESGPQSNGAVGVAHSPLQAPGGPWGAADFSVFESAPARLDVQAPAPPAPSLVESSAMGPPAPNKPGAAVAAPSGRTIKQRSSPAPVPIGTSTASSSTGDPQHQDDETARRILANLPDLSYMLR